MLISTSKKILEQRLKGIRPTPDDDMLSEYGLEALVYIATRTTPKTLTMDLVVEGDDYTVLRMLEDNMFIVYPDKPVYDIASPDYSATSQLNMDEELSYAAVYYMAWLILVGNESGSRAGVARDRFKKQVDDYITLYDSNYTRAGRETYDLM